MKDSTVQLLHYAPGRARLKITPLRGNQELATRVESEMQSVPGIHGVEVNALTGSVLVHFNDEELLQPDSIAMLKETLQGLFPLVDFEALQRRLLSAVN